MRLRLRGFDPLVKGCAVTFAIALGCQARCAAQSSNPETLRRIIQQKNAEAAAATWAGHTGFPSQPGPGSAPGAGSGGAASGTPGSAATSSSGGAASFASPDDARATKPVRPEAAQPGSVPVQAAQAVRLPSSRMLDNTGLGSSSEGPTGIVPVPGAVPASLEANRPLVSFRDGKLALHAENASLEEILQAISQATGMQISGSLPDERVFGDLGPATPAEVLTRLLDGTSSNRLIREDGRSQVKMLVLSPRTSSAVAPRDTATPR